MPVEINCKDFPHHLAVINGAKSIYCSKAKLLLSALTCGYDGFFKVFGQNWLNRVLHICGNVLPYISVGPGGALALDTYYFATDRSESTQGIYYIGQGLTKLFAQQILDAPIVLHASRCTWQPAVGTASKAPHVQLKRQEADLFAFSNTSVHVLESKGRSIQDGSGVLNRSAFNSALNEALVQVSAVQLVNGAVPTSRSACIWSLCTSGIRGDIVDPPGNGLNAVVEEAEILRGNYALFIDAMDEAFKTDLLPGYSLLPLKLSGETETYIGVATNILEMLRADDATVERAISIADNARRATPDIRAEFMTDGTTLFARGESRLLGVENVPLQRRIDAHGYEQPVDANAPIISRTDELESSKPVHIPATIYLSN